MKIDLSKCKTKEDAERALKPLGQTVRRIKTAMAKYQSACTCKSHKHIGGRGGCYFGGALVPACGCKYVDEP